MIRTNKFLEATRAIFNWLRILSKQYDERVDGSRVTPNVTVVYTTSLYVLKLYLDAQAT